MSARPKAGAGKCLVNARLLHDWLRGSNGAVKGTKAMNLSGMGCLKRAERLFYVFYRVSQVAVFQRVVRLDWRPFWAASIDAQANLLP